MDDDGCEICHRTGVSFLKPGIGGWGFVGYASSARSGQNQTVSWWAGQVPKDRAAHVDKIVRYHGGIADG